MFSFLPAIILLPALTLVVGFIAGIIAIVKIFHRLDRIEKKIGLKEEQSVPTEAHDVQEKTARERMDEMIDHDDGFQPSRKTQKKTTATPSGKNAFVQWMTDNWLMKLGALLIIIAVGWFVTYAFMEGWIGPQGRIALGLAFGVSVMVGGKVRAKSHADQGGVLLALGSTIFVLTMFAARFMYGFFTPLTAMGAMLLSVSFVALASVLHKSRWLAFSSLVLASVVPLLTAGQPGVLGTMGYMAIVVVGTLWVVALTNWRYLTLGSLIATALYSFEFISPGISAADQQTALLFVFGFVAFFAVMNVVSFIREKYEDLSLADLIVSVGNGVLLLIWILQAVPAEWQSLTLAAWAIVFTAGSFAVYRFLDNPAPFFAYSGVAGGMVAAATAVELSGAVLTMAYTIEILILLLLLGQLTRKKRVLSFVSFLFSVPAVMSLQSFDSPAWNAGIFHADFAVLVLLMVVFAVSAYAVRSLTSSTDTGTDSSSKLANIYALLATFYATALVWLVTHAMPSISNELATGISLAIYAIAGVGFYLIGKQLQRKTIRYLGLTFVWGVVGRLLFVEVWTMSLVGKVITFFVVGGLFMGTAFLEKSDEDDNNLNK